MMKTRYAAVLLLAMGILFPGKDLISCSMYKVTVGDKTIVGNNEDSWRTDAQVWFEPAPSPGKYGTVYVGYSGKSNADGGMNEAGLAFDGFVVPARTPKPQPGKKDFGEIYDMRLIMQTCATIEEVCAVLSGYDLSVLNGGMIFITDRFGNYVSVECDTLVRGNDPSYVVANFCPSNTPDPSVVQMGRYKKGVAFLKQGSDTSLSFCTRLSDTMHVCRDKIGDGTLYTCIYDLNARVMHLFFYHDYKREVSFNLNEELKKGAHVLVMKDLFPPNSEFQQLENFKTPANNGAVRGYVLFGMVLFGFQFVFFLVRLFRKKGGVNLYIAGVNALLFYYTFTLMGEHSIYYYPAPYADPTGNVALSGFIPIVSVLCLIPLVLLLIRTFRNKSWNRFALWTFATGTGVYISFVVLFGYWGLLNIF